MRITNHTADVGFEQEATSLENLFEEERPAFGATAAVESGRNVARLGPLIVVRG